MVNPAKQAPRNGGRVQKGPTTRNNRIEEGREGGSLREGGYEIKEVVGAKCK